MRLGLARRLAEILAAEHVPVSEVSAAALTSIVRTHLPHAPRRDAEGAA